MSNGSLPHSRTVNDARLTVIDGRASQSELPLKLPAVLGRGENVTVLVKDKEKRVSRNHCEITVVDGSLVVRDLNSKNGTFVNGARITESALRPGDSLSVGPLTFRIQYTPVKSAPPPRPKPAPAAMPRPEPVSEPAPAAKSAGSAISEDEIDFLLNLDE